MVGFGLGRKQVMKKIYVDFAIGNQRKAAERCLAGGRCEKGCIITKTEKGNYIINSIQSVDQENYGVFQFDEKSYLLV